MSLSLVRLVKWSLVSPVNPLMFSHLRRRRKMLLFNDNDDNGTPTAQSIISREKIETELLWYSHEEVLDLKSDPLEWWKLKSATYPNLSRQVQRMWTLPASSMKSEEIFSTAGNIHTLKRNRLLPQHVMCFYMLMSSHA